MAFPHRTHEKTNRRRIGESSRLASCQVRVRVPKNNFERRGKRGKGEDSGYKDNKKDPAPSGLGLCWVRKKREIGAGGEGKEARENCIEGVVGHERYESKLRRGPQIACQNTQRGIWQIEGLRLAGKNAGGGGPGFSG